ncbi:hypothetical protein QQF64_027127 [Cirrhinus molitorella]|uniref:Uncharacterized protein n=1 Tax=Cirrhinus molitorella TaxID=172907 RepID=A0ABR3NC46_9TELE
MSVPPHRSISIISRQRFHPRSDPNLKQALNTVAASRGRTIYTSALRRDMSLTPPALRSSATKSSLCQQKTLSHVGKGVQ